MHVACKCLNVSIKSKGNEMQRVNVEDYELTATELADPFFREVNVHFIYLIYEISTRLLFIIIDYSICNFCTLLSFIVCTVVNLV